MKAMIFAAGLGTRLYPMTQSLPKALIKIKNTPLIEIVIKRLVLQGFDEIIINLHHFSRQIEEFIHGMDDFGITIRFSDEKGELLDTGGGLKKASWFFDDEKPFLVHNVDIISNIDLTRLLDFHNRSHALATLAVRSRPSSRYLYFDSKNNLCGWENTKTNERIMVRSSEDERHYAFSGIQVINPKIFKLNDREGPFSIIDLYLRLAGHHSIQCFDHTDSLWLDVGKPDSLIKAELLMDLIHSTDPDKYI
jgi:NDP-sugar pyrophosphorylase family protein